jgi:hypothetical protein
MDYSIVTLPRVGSNYLQDRILQHTGMFVPRHHVTQDNKMITIARDPIDFLTSEVAMSYFYDTSSNTLDKLVNSTLRNLWLNDYSKYFTKTDDMTIVDQFEIIIDYDRLINFPVETIKSVARHMGVEIITQDYESGRLKDYTEHGHIISSKKVKEYDMIRKYIEDTDLSKLYEIYHAMLDRAIG